MPDGALPPGELGGAPDAAGFVVASADPVRDLHRLTVLRNPASAFFTFVFPLMFLVILTSLLGHYTVRIGDRSIDTSTYYVASMGTFAAISACFNNVATAITFQREEGVLKRANGTPLPAASYIGARIAHAVAISVVLVALTVIIAFGNDTPSWILWIARIFPVRHFALGMQSAFLGTPFSWADVLVVAAWGPAACSSPSATSAGTPPGITPGGQRELKAESGITQDLWPLVPAVPQGLSGK